MRRGIVTLLGVLIAMLIGTVGVVSAGQAPSPEEQLRDAVIRIDRAATALGEAETVSRLAAAFKVPGRAVSALHDEKLDFGEVAMVLALAEASKTKPEAILSLWATDRLSWSEIGDRNKVGRPALLKRLDGIRRALARSPAPKGGSPAR
jgi:hypothetical protein